MSTVVRSRMPVRVAAHADAAHHTRRRFAVLTALFLLVIVSVIPWRPQAFYAGGVDPVVLAKAAIALVALGGAAALTLYTRHRIPVGLGPAAVLALTLAVSLLGGVVAGNGTATAVLVTRVFIVMATLLLLLTNAPWDRAVAALLTAMSLVAIVAAATGARTLAGGRLGGGIPEIHPNELAGLAALPLIALVILVLRRGVRAGPVAGIVVLFAIVVATGSRIALVGTLAGAIVALITNGVRRRGVLYALLAFVPLVYAVVVFTGVVDGLASRGGTSAESTALDSRLTGWQVVLGWDWTSWERWLGVGLSVKEVAVQEKWRSSQVLDSSWVSLLAQAGLVGVVLVGLLVAWCLVTAVTAGSRRGLVLPLLTMFVIRTFTESGMVDSAMPFVLFVTLSAVLTRRSRHGDRPPPDDRPRIHPRQAGVVGVR